MNDAKSLKPILKESYGGKVKDKKFKKLAKKMKGYKDGGAKCDCGSKDCYKCGGVKGKKYEDGGFGSVFAKEVSKRQKDLKKRQADDALDEPAWVKKLSDSERRKWRATEAAKKKKLY